jgi:hypothetical protein
VITLRHNRGSLIISKGKTDPLEAKLTCNDLFGGAQKLHWLPVPRTPQLTGRGQTPFNVA